MQILLIVAVIVVILIVLWYLTSTKERLAGSQEYIKLYDWDNYYLAPIYTITEGTRMPIKINLRKIDYKLTRPDSAVYIYSYYEGNNTSSIRGEFYNSYGDLFKMNPVKYQLVFQISGPGEGSYEFTTPIKNIFGVFGIGE